MTRKVLIESQALERAAEKAGGFVADPSTLKCNPKGEREFSIIRQYSLKHKIPVSKLTEQDYRNMGISR